MLLATRIEPSTEGTFDTSLMDPQTQISKLNEAKDSYRRVFINSKKINANRTKVKLAKQH